MIEWLAMIDNSVAAQLTITIGGAIAMALIMTDRRHR